MVNVQAESSKGPADGSSDDGATDGRSDMNSNPSIETASAQDSLPNRRRSTRVDFVTTILLSGKDAGGMPFREFTQTTIVNMHGCRVRTSYRIMVGTLITIECPKVGTAGKGVCVKVWDPPLGVAGHEIALQLIKPQNLWGVPNPPADWESGPKNPVDGRTGQGDRTGQAASTAPHASKPATRPSQTSMPAGTAVVGSGGGSSAVTPSRSMPAPNVTVDQRLAELERRSIQLMESVLDILRGQAEEITRICLEEFRQQVEALVQDSETRLRQGVQHTFEESAATLISLRSDLMEKMAARGAQLTRSLEDVVRTRLRSQLGGEEKPAPDKPPSPVEGK